MTKLIGSNYVSESMWLYLLFTISFSQFRKFNAFYWLSSIMTINDYLSLMTKISFEYISITIKTEIAVAIAKILFIILLMHIIYVTNKHTTSEIAFECTNFRCEKCVLNSIIFCFFFCHNLLLKMIINKIGNPNWFY